MLDIEIWSEVKFDTLNTEIKKMSEKERFDIYFLCKPDIPWEDDPLRENPNDREFLFNKFKEKLSKRKLNYYKVGEKLKIECLFALILFQEINKLLLLKGCLNIRAEIIL